MLLLILTLPPQEKTSNLYSAKMAFQESAGQDEVFNVSFVPKEKTAFLAVKTKTKRSTLYEVCRLKNGFFFNISGMRAIILVLIRLSNKSGITSGIETES